MKQYHPFMQQCLTEYGAEAQIEQLIEECSELILALQKYKRERRSQLFIQEQTISDVNSELADVLIMCEQSRFIFQNDEIDQWVERKIERQRERMKKRLARKNEDSI